MLDSDRDGLPDSWEVEKFGSPTGQLSEGDPDHDGVSNLDEFLEGTDPTSPTSLRPRLVAYSDVGGSVTVTPIKPNYGLGESVKLTASPSAPNVVFVGWAGDLISTTNPATLAMNGNKTVRARFASADLLPPGLVSWWRAENDARDVMGANHATLGTGITFRAGKVGQAFSFDGTAAAEVKVLASETLNVGAGSGFTIELWIKPTDAIYPLLEWNDGSRFGVNLWIAEQHGTTGRIGSLFANIVDTTSARHIISSPKTPSGEGLIRKDDWQHVAVTYDRASGISTLILNGAQVATANLGIFIPLTMGDLYIGHRRGDAFYSGLIDEPTIYNRALTAKEIFSIYNADFVGKDFTRPYFTSPSQLPDVVLGASYTQQLTTILGTPPIGFSISAGAPPPGIALSSAGMMSGAPGTAGTFAFTTRATDAAGLFREQLCSLQVFRTVMVPAGLTGWWRAEGNALDSSASANHGTPRNGAAFATGKVGQAFSLDGTDDFIEIPDSPALRPISLTLEAWAVFDATSGIRAIIIKPVGTGTSDSYGLWLQNGTLNGAVGGSAGMGPILSTRFSLTPGRWYHLAYTFDDSTKEQALYVDGVQVAIGAASKSAGYDTQSLLLGRDTENGAPNFFLKGRIDEAAIYNRALNPIEITSIYNAGPAGKRL
jgi:hypothetical protein